MATHDTQWLTLGQASDLLGIHATTLRLWVKNGQIRAFRTPGGHRRFRHSEIREFISHSRTALAQPQPILNQDVAIRNVRERIGPFLAREQSRVRDNSVSGQSVHKETGRRLLVLLVDLLLGSRTSDVVLNEARTLGREYGTGFKRSNLPVSEVARAFVFFRRMIDESISTIWEQDASRMQSWTDATTSIDIFMDELMIAILSGYENADSPTSVVASDRQPANLSPRHKSRRLAAV